jgi:hypothetical protein
LTPAENTTPFLDFKPFVHRNHLRLAERRGQDKPQYVSCW